jgi:hypothetical protein
VFGYDLAVEVRASMHSTEVVTKHFSTPKESTARSRAKNTKNFVRVLAIRPLNQQSYIAAYGDPNSRI